MTKRADYTPDEWRILSRAIANVVFVILMVDVTSEQELFHEASVAYNRMDERMEEHKHNELLMAMDKDRDDVPDPNDPVQALEEIRQAVAIIEEKATPKEKTGVTQFLYELAEEVAQAYAERDGISISDKEQAMLQQLQEALGI